MDRPTGPARVVRRSPVKPRFSTSRWLSRHRWTVAVFIVAIGVGAGVSVPLFDERVQWHSSISFDSSTAQATLAAIAGGMITLTGFVFTGVTLVIQTVQTQSPRLLGAIDRTDATPIVFGMFTATFTYALVVLSQVRADDVPSVAVYVAIALVLVCVGSFFRLLVTLRRRLTSGGLVRIVGDELRASFDELYPPGRAALEGAGQRLFGQGTPVAVRYWGPPGCFQWFDEPAVVDWAERHDVAVELHPVVGDFVNTGAVIATVHARNPTAGAPAGPIPGRPEGDGHELVSWINVGRTRTLDQDPAYGFRLLADVAVRALSPAVNDPTTAVQTLDQIDDLLHRLVERPLGQGELVDGSGVIRVSFPAPRWATFVSLALDEIRLFGAGSLQVVRRLRSLLLGLIEVAPPRRLPPLEERLAALDQMLDAFAVELDRALAGEPDAQGLGTPEVL